MPKVKYDPNVAYDHYVGDSVHDQKDYRVFYIAYRGTEHQYEGSTLVKSNSLNNAESEFKETNFSHFEVMNDLKLNLLEGHLKPADLVGTSLEGYCPPDAYGKKWDTVNGGWH